MHLIQIVLAVLGLSLMGLFGALAAHAESLNAEILCTFLALAAGTLPALAFRLVPSAPVDASTPSA